MKLPALALALLLVASSCSGDGDEGSAPTTTADTSTTTTATATTTTTATTVPTSDLLISGPVTAGTRGTPGTATPVDLDAAGYLEEEYFLSGEATSYRADGALSTDGVWSVEEDTSAPFTTRLLIRRPIDSANFSGTALVEWFNVSSNVDVDVDFGFMSDEILRNGDIWVGVSAQAVGITSSEGGDFGAEALGLKAWDPDRYDELAHPGDAFAYDIFSSAGEAVRNPGGSDLLAGYDIEQVLAIGESQSAFRLITYVNAVHPLAEVYDGYLIHSRDGGGAPLNDDIDSVPQVIQVRSDLDVPVLQLISETDLYGLRPTALFPDARQPDTDFIRTWEMAGTAHADGYYLAALYAQGSQNFDSFLDLTAIIPIANNGPQHWIAKAALRGLRIWAAGTTVPPNAEPLTTEAGAILRDEYGIALGGIRTPHVDVPVATLTGEGSSFIGSTTPLPAETIAALYPTEADYLAAYTESLDAAVAAGFILADDVEAILAEAARGFPQS